MEKRKIRKEQQHEQFRSKLQKIFAVFLCIALLAFFLNLTDISTRRMMMCNDDRYAMAVSLQEGDMLRFDIAGEKLMVNVGPVIRLADYVAAGSKRCYEELVKFVDARL